MDCVACGLKATTRILIDDEIFDICSRCKDKFDATIEARKICEEIIKEGGNKG